jgi:hypothetical protein
MMPLPNSSSIKGVIAGPLTSPQGRLGAKRRNPPHRFTVGDNPGGLRIFGAKLPYGRRTDRLSKSAVAAVIFEHLECLAKP